MAGSNLGERSARTSSWDRFPARTNCRRLWHRQIQFHAAQALSEMREHQHRLCGAGTAFGQGRTGVQYFLSPRRFWLERYRLMDGTARTSLSKDHSGGRKYYCRGEIVRSERDGKLCACSGEVRRGRGCKRPGRGRYTGRIADHHPAACARRGKSSEASGREEAAPTGVESVWRRVRKTKCLKRLNSVPTVGALLSPTILLLKMSAALPAPLPPMR